MWKNSNRKKPIFLCVLLLLLVGLMFSSALLSAQSPHFTLPEQQELNRIKSAVLTTNRGKIYFELYPEEAPWHVANFKYLADKNFYNDLLFHIYQRGYIIQGGAPRNNPNGGPGYNLPPEFNDHRHRLGSLGMARKGDQGNITRESNGSQFHILLGDAPHMNGSYTVFGRVIEGLDVLQDLRRGDRIQKLEVFVRD